MSRHMRNQMLGNRYRILGLIGEGGMASVYRANDMKLDRKVAVKVLHPHLSQNEDIRHRFQQEARALSGIDHPNILKIYDFSGVESDQLWIVTEIIKGSTLTDYVRQFSRSSLHPIMAAIIVQEVGRALECAHGQGIVHRDVKPDNIMVLVDGHIKLMDFGIAKDGRASSMTMTGTFMGSPSYMSPEQVRGRDIDHRSDIYSLAVLFYEIVTGVLPYSGGSTADVINKILVGKFLEPIAISPSLPQDVNAMILKGMAGEASRRYQNAGDFIRDLSRFLSIHGFMESHIELERFFRDRPAFEARLRRVNFMRQTAARGGVRTTVEGDRVVLAQEPSLAATEIITPAQRPSRRLPPPPGRLPEARQTTRHTAHTQNRRVARVSRRETQIFPSSSSQSLRFVGMAIIGLFFAAVLWGAFELADRLKAVKEQPQTSAPPAPVEQTSRPTPTPAPVTQPVPVEQTEATRRATPPEPPATAKRATPSAPEPKPTTPKKTTPRRERAETSRTETRRPPRRLIEPTPAFETLTPPPPSAVTLPPAPIPVPSAPEPEAAPPVKPRASTAQVVINAQPAAEIFVNGRQQGTTNDPDIRLRGIKLPAGRHQIELRRRGFSTATRTLTLEGGDTKTLNIRLEKDQKSLVRLTIHSNRAPAKVTIEETGGAFRRELDITGETVSVNLKTAVYKVRVEHGSQVIERSVTIGGDRDALTFYAEFREE